MTKGPLHTSLCDDLGIQHPIILAGMGMKGRATPPALVAAVSEAGGLGVLGGSGLDGDAIRRAIRRVRDLTGRPFGVDLLLPASMAEAMPDRAEMRLRIRRDHPRHWEFVQSLREKFNLPPAEARGGVMSPAFIRGQVDACLEERVPVFAAALGDPSWVVPLARPIGMKVMGLVGNVRNARRQVQAGVDYVIAQGHEAGGHTGKIANFALIPQVVDAVSPAPVLAAGAIADGRGVAAALALGAVGAWVGTAFLLADECEIHAGHKAQIIRSGSEDFVVSRTYTGKTARVYRNEVVAAWDASGLSPLPMPLQGVLMDDFVAAAEEAGRAELTNNPVGQIGGMLTRTRPARDILRSMVDDAAAVLDHLASMRAASARR